MDEDKRKIRTVEKPIPFSSVRLVVTLTNKETGVREDFICKEVHKDGSRRYINMPDGSVLDLTGQKKKRKTPGAPGSGEDTPADTFRMELEQKTFVPTLLRPPMPGSVIDELRNKYSVFRTRHDPEYIAAKMKEDEEKEEKKKLIKKMRTPLNEINRLERKMRKAKGKGKLTDRMLERIGEIIATKKQLQLDADGTSKEPEVVVA
jgi:large subunit ribosomal protein L24